jgi:cullin-associated NEDD8-dissociated protein 1
MPLLGERLDQNHWWGSSVAQVAAEHEVEALLDHLFEHPNTAPFLAHRLIQRFVSSNPSPRYVAAVAHAFRAGEYPAAGREFSGNYGDMGATIAAVLLDREARAATLDVDPQHGKLREPLLKVIHLMRAMEYKPHRGRELVLSQMEEKVGMAPFMSPSVFNFYQPDYGPQGPLSASGLVSPEAELATAPMVVGYLNGMCSLIDVGLTGSFSTNTNSLCIGGFGDALGKPRRGCSAADKASGVMASTADGALSFAVSADPTDTVGVIAELDLLLTDGRLSTNSRRVVAAAYNEKIAQSGSAAEALKKAQKLIIASPEFHATGRVVHDGPRQSPTPPLLSLDRPFRAIVVVFLVGGVDSYNLLIPHSECSRGDLYTEYAGVRTNVALQKSELLPINVTNGTQPCGRFGMHPSLPFVHSLYEKGDATWVANIGSLVEPVTQDDYRFKRKRLPPDLFAHNVQQWCMHSVHAQYTGAKGVLGRITEALAGAVSHVPFAAQLFSLVGNIKMLEGSSPPMMIHPKAGINRFEEFTTLAQPLANLTALKSRSMFAETYAEALESSLRTTEAVGHILANTSLENEARFDQSWMVASGHSTTNTIALQLKQVAKLLKIRRQLNAERAAFVTHHGSFDTHTDLGETLGFGMADMDDALLIFADELKAQGLWNNVTIVTVSDFGRTLTSNGLGTDHAWGGNHLVIGGGVKGGQVLGQFPPLAAESELDVGRGRLIPTTPWEVSTLQVKRLA